MSISDKGFNLVDCLVEEAMHYTKELVHFNCCLVDSIDFDNARVNLEAYIEELEERQ